MGCLPYLKWYPESWLSDRKVRRLPADARCLYRELLDVSWLEEGIPADAEELVELADWLGFKRRTFERLWPKVEQFWVHGSDGKLVNPRQAEEYTEAMTVYQQRVEAGKKGGRPKANGSQP